MTIELFNKIKQGIENAKQGKKRVIRRAPRVDKIVKNIVMGVQQQ